MERAAPVLLSALATLAMCVAAYSYPAERPSGAQPLSYFFADNKLLEEDIVNAVDDDLVDPATRISEYLSLVERSRARGAALQPARPHRTRRDSGGEKLVLPPSLTKDPHGLFILSDLKPRFIIPAKFPDDVVVFPHPEPSGAVAWYAAALETDGPNPEASLSNALVLYKLMDTRFVEQTRVETFGASSLAVQAMEGWTYILAAERAAELRAPPERGSTLFRVSKDGRDLKVVQRLETLHPSDLCFWQYMGDHYLAVTAEFTNTSGVVSYSAETLVMKWLGEHLDIVYRLPTKGARAATAFVIGSTQYLGVANHVDDSGNTNIESVVYRHDVAADSFVVHQFLRTHAAVDVAFFSMDRPGGQDYFLAVANSYQQGEDKVKNPATNSVIYKWSGNHFAPFQSVALVGARQWTAYQGPHGERLLLATSDFGLHVFQYDGWVFQQLDMSGSAALAGPNSWLSSVRTLVVNSEGLLVFANKLSAGSAPNVFSMTFDKIRPLEDLHSAIRSWCESRRAELQSESLDTLLAEVKTAPKWDSTRVVIDSITFNSASNVNTLRTKLGNSTLDESSRREFDALEAGLDAVRGSLDAAKSVIDGALKKDGVNRVDRVVMDSAIVSCPVGGCRFESARVDKLNNVEVDALLRDTVRLDADISLPELHFAHTVVPGDLTTTLVLDRDASPVSRTTTRRLLGRLDVNELVVDVGLDVGGTIDGVRFAPDVVLLKDGDQTLNGFSSLTHWQVNKLVLRGRVNGLTLDVTRPVLPPEAFPAPVNPPPASLTVKDLNLGGLLGGVDVRDLARRALRTSGRQEVTGALSFAQLRTGAASAGRLSGALIEDVVRVDKDELFPLKLIFSQPLTAQRVQVYERMNDVGVAQDFSMDLLLRTGLAGAQNVTGHKRVRALRVTEKARVHHHVKELVPPRQEQLLTFVKEDVTIEGDVTITGKVKVAGSVVADDISEPSSGASLVTVVERGVLLTDPLPDSVVVEDLEVTNVDVTFVNNINTETWIVDSPDVTVRVTKPATFDGDLIVTGESHLIGQVNGVDLVTLDKTTLKTTGDQVIFGHKNFKSITTPQIWSNDTVVNDVPWKDIVAHQEPAAGTRLPTVLPIDGDVVVDGDLLAKRLIVSGLVDGLKLDTLLEDTVFEDKPVVIDGPKTFTQTLEVLNLDVDPSASGGLGPLLLPHASPSHGDTLLVPASDLTNKKINVGRLHFTGTLNGVSAAEWAEPWLMMGEDQTLTGRQTFLGNVDALSGVGIAGGLNGKSLTKFAEQVAMTDDPNLQLGIVSFADTVSALAPVTAGGLDGVVLEEALLARGASTQTQVITGDVVLGGGLDVGGTLVVAGRLAGENFKDMCSFATPSPATPSDPQELTVLGNVRMVREPTVMGAVNGQEMKKLLKNTWLRRLPANIDAVMQFGDVNFLNDVTVQGLIDGVNLDRFATNYVSLTKMGQVITTKFVVDGEINIEGDLLSTGPVDVAGLVNGVRLTELADQVLMDEGDQDVLAHMTFGSVATVSDLSLNGTVNGLDLGKDVVLMFGNARDALLHNIVTEPKSFLGATVTELGPEPGARVQGVDLEAWASGAVRVEGNYVIEGAKTLHQPNIASELTVGGVVNGIRVHEDSLLLRHADQVVTGAKAMSPAIQPGLGLRVTDLTMTGRVNEVDLGKLLTTQAYKNQDVEVSTQLVVDPALRGSSASLHSLFQGVNVTELIFEAMHPERLNEYPAEYEALRLRAERVRRSLEAQGYYLNHYHASVELGAGVRAVLPMGRADSLLHNVDPAAAIAVIKELSPGGDVVANFFLFDAATGTLVNHDTLHMVGLGPSVHIVEPADFTGLNAIYWEVHDRSSGLFIGYVLGLTRIGKLGVAEMFRDSVASSWVAVRSWNAESSCLIRGSPGSFDKEDGFCTLNCLPGSAIHSLPVSRPMHATTLLVHGSPLLFVASGASKASEGSVGVWRYGGPDADPVLLQTLQVVNASALAAVEYRGVHYLAAASGHVEGAPHGGLVQISRYTAQLGNWSHWVSVEVEGPRSLQFSALPSGELVLYVTTTCATDSLVVLQYRGMGGFERRAAAAAPAGGPMSAFTTAGHQHVVALASAPAGRALLLQANFKGSWDASTRSLWAAKGGQ